MIYITGDTHGDFRRFSTTAFPEQSQMTKDDLVIICGDFGGVWDYKGESAHEEYWLDWLDNKPFTTCFVDGNHECFQRLYDMPVEHWNGGKVHKIRPTVIHLMRGQIFKFGGLKFFTFGGASSHDILDGILDVNDYPDKAMFDRVRREYTKAGKMFRIKNQSWWQLELPTNAEMIEGVNNLVKNGNSADYVVSHCLPSSVNAYISFGEYNTDKLNRYFQDLLDKGLEFKHWFSGHLHFNCKIDTKFSVLYEQIIRVV